MCNHPDLLQRAKWEGAPDYGNPARSGKLTVAMKARRPALALALTIRHARDIPYINSKLVNCSAPIFTRALLLQVTLDNLGGETHRGPEQLCHVSHSGFCSKACSQAQFHYSVVILSQADLQSCCGPLRC